MTIHPARAPKRRRARFAVYDLEWIPGKMDLRMIGVLDGMGYRHYEGATNEQIVDAFFKEEITAKHKSVWFYAHAGGLADVQFLLEYLIERPEYEVNAAFSGASAIIVKVKKSASSWYFVDSYWTLRESIKTIGTRLGLYKGEVDWDAPIDQLIEYNRRDCEILWEALNQFEEGLIALGSELRMTLASCAMRLVTRRYLKKPIKNNSRLNRDLRPAYVGGRVEVFYKNPHAGWYFDINSCYPDAMTKPLPGNLIRVLNRLPKPGSAVCYIADVTIDVPEDLMLSPIPLIHDTSLYFATGRRRQWLCGPEIERALDVGCKLDDVHRCYVYDQRDDLARFAREIYGKRLKEKNTCTCGHTKKEHAGACSRCACRKFQAGYMELVYKLLLNSGYGKFGERPDKCSLLVNPSEKTFLEALEMARASAVDAARGRRNRPLRDPRRFDTGHLHMITPGAWIIEKEASVKNAHVPIAAYTTSYARVGLDIHMRRSRGLPIYCDTDGFALPGECACTNPRPMRARCLACARFYSECSCPKDQKGKSVEIRCSDCGEERRAPTIPLGDELGELKLEKQYLDALFHAPKLYYLAEAGGNEIVRAKGFSGICDCLTPLPIRLGEKCPGCGLERGQRFGRAGFEKLIAGQASIVGRMLRIKELYGHGETRPRETPREGPDVETKEVLGGNPKRKFSSDGSSRPWTIEELERDEHRGECYE